VIVDDDRSRERDRMVADQIASRGVGDPAVLAAMRRVPRHVFVPPAEAHSAYADAPLPIGRGQTISQPYIVGLMTQLARPDPEGRVLEIGTGCGYQTAVLAECYGEVWSIELEPELSARAAETLSALGYSGVRLRVGDGALGWPEAAPFDAIVVTAAPDEVPRALYDQLAISGRLVIPLGASHQDLWVFSRTPTGLARRSVIPVRFVPMR
jgi:protein-L-isoaspartate(D-aspartate) O-methyltransferase